MRGAAMRSNCVSVRCLRAAGAVFICLVLLAPRGEAQLLTSIGDPARGEQIFRAKSCAVCHGPSARGSAQGPALAKSVRQRQPIELAGVIWNHLPKMTATAQKRGIAIPALSGAETGDILAYLYSLGFVDEPGDPQRGLALLKQKHCLSCHGANGSTATDAPPLRDVARFSNSIAMLDAMWHHAADMQGEMRAQQLRRVTFAGDDMVDILAYLRGLAGLPNNVRPLQGDARAGAKLLTSKGCTRCHSVNGQGGRVSQDLGVRSMPRTPSALSGLIWNHGFRMRELMARYQVPVPAFTRAELTNLVAYLYFLGFNDTKGDPFKGRALFEQRGCSRCHGTGADMRERIGPDLSRSSATSSSIEAARLMWQHAPEMQDRFKELGLQWPQFQRTELADLLAYVTSLPGRATQ